MSSKVLRFLLVSLGGAVAASGMVNLIAAVVLLEPSDEAALGISRPLMIAGCVTAMLAGAALIYLGMRKKK